MVGNTVVDLLLKWHHKYCPFVLITSLLGITQELSGFYRPKLKLISSSKGLKNQSSFLSQMSTFPVGKKQSLIAIINFVKWSINAHNNIEVESFITPTERTFKNRLGYRHR